jgi:hypothetical protein
MEGGNYVLSKGFLMTGTTAVMRGQLVKMATGSTLDPAQCAITAAITDRTLGVLQEDLDVGKVTTGKAYVGVAILGIAQCIAGEALTAGMRVSSNAGSAGPPDTRGRVIEADATSIPLGIVMTTAAAAGDYVSVLLTPDLPAV